MSPTVFSAVTSRILSTGSLKLRGKSSRWNSNIVEVGVRVGRGLWRGGDRGPLLSSSARRESADDEDDSECRGESLDAIKT